MMNYEIWKKETWDKAHQEKDVSALTGTELPGHLGTLGVVDLAKPECAVLCIGVGMGKWVHQACQQFTKVHALDVTRNAAKSIPNDVPLTLDPRELPSDTFDLALSLWVAPHMTDHDLGVQLREVVRSLKPTGVLAMHYKEPLDENAPLDNRQGAEDEWRLAGAAGMLRRRRHFDALVGWAGGRVIDRPVQCISKFHQIIEVSAHIAKGV